MGERYYPNEMPENSIQEMAPPENAKDSLSNLLSLPYDTISKRLKEDSLNLKDEVFIFIFSSCIYYGVFPTELFNFYVLICVLYIGCEGDMGS